MSLSRQQKNSYERNDPNFKCKWSPETIPTVSFAHQRAAAEERKAAYPYRFPRDRQAAWGQIFGRENARRLLRLFYFERRLMQALGALDTVDP